jgi:hypothetical protein
MWAGQEWGGYVLADTVSLPSPSTFARPSTFPIAGHVLLAAADAAALVVLVLLLGGRLPGRPFLAPANRP